MRSVKSAKRVRSAKSVKSETEREEEERVFYTVGIEGMCAKGYLIMDGGIEKQRGQAARKGGREVEGEESERRNKQKGKRKKETGGGRANESR